MKKSGLFSEKFCDAIVRRTNGYSNSNTIEGQMDILTSIVIDLSLLLREKGVLKKKDLLKIAELHPHFED